MRIPTRTLADWLVDEANDQFKRSHYDTVLRFSAAGLERLHTLCDRIDQLADELDETEINVDQDPDSLNFTVRVSCDPEHPSDAACRLFWQLVTAGADAHAEPGALCFLLPGPWESAT